MVDEFMKQLDVDLGDRSYPIYIGDNLLGSDLVRKHVKAEQVMIVTNQTVAPLYLEHLVSALEGLVVDVCTLPDGEEYKSLETLQLVFDRLLECGHTRSTTIVALGGGVVGDMAGFAAASYQRGVRFIQVPTTLLSQVDSSVGGKTGVNHPLGKNMIGAFYQPHAVIADTSTLITLPFREYAAGIAEVIKYGLIAMPEFFQWMLDNSDALVTKEHNALTHAIEMSCRCKADVVAKDEFEGGIRAILNLGHTFGHAIETDQGYGSWLHGEAVAAGMMVAAQLSHLRADYQFQKEDVDRLRDFLKVFELPAKVPETMSFARFMELMARDKKADYGKIKLILMHKLGQAVVTADTDPLLIESAIDLCR